VLRDIIHGNLAPTTVLTEVVRQAGVLKVNSTKVLSGVVAPTAVNDPGWAVVDSFKEAVHIQTYLRDLILRLIPERLGYDPVRDVQIITPTHKGPLGTKAVNEMMQHLLHGRVEGRFAVGEKVIQTSNDYTLGVMNGTIGRVVDIDGGAYHVDFDGEGVKTVDGERIGNVQLAYCLTAHKAQGSEFPCVVVLCHKSHYFADRNWLYTAVTRAARTCILVGDRWGLHHAAGKNNTIRRRTFLSRWAREGDRARS
jgi:exodeoxyribonuclease V alpha subunit